jgi:hypothetical protein
MSKDLKTCLTRMAIDADSFTEFASDPRSFAGKSGLSANDQAILLSGDQNRIYRALQGQPGKDDDPPT